MRTALYLVVLTLAGCGQLFELKELDPIADASPLDAFVPAVDCPPSYAMELIQGGSRYRVLELNSSPAMNHALCAADSFGAVTHLAVLDSPQEALAIQAALDATDTYGWFVGAVQPKGTSAPDEGWLWLTGEPVPPYVWDAVSEPNDIDDTENDQENVAHLLSKRVGLVDGMASASHPAICECDGRPIDPAVGTIYDNI